jgi:heptose I phosphotransferase
MIKLESDFAATFDKNADLFDEVMKIEGNVFREMPGRKTLQFERAGKSYFIKKHFGVGWREIFKNISQFKIPVIGAKNEWKAINKLDDLGVDTMRLVGYGCRGINPAKRCSFVVTEDLVNTMSLEDYCAKWLDEAPLSGERLKIKRQLINKVATVGRILHDNGVNHQDFYLVHFLLDLSIPPDEMAKGKIIASLIDLHRVQIRSETPLRWRLKDVGAIFFASLDIGLTKRDLFRFIKIYSNKPLREALSKDKDFWQTVFNRAVNLYNKLNNKDPEFLLRIGLIQK